MANEFISNRCDAIRLEDLSAWEGEFVHLTGPSGSGKSTLLNLIAGLDRPGRGQISVAGVDIARLSLAAAARYRGEQVGFVFQSYHLLPQLTALETVLLPMIPRHRFDRGRALELLDAVELDDRSIACMAWRSWVKSTSVLPRSRHKP